MVYLTDNNKFYAREQNYVRRNFEELYNAFRYLVLEEIRCERPEFIITVGDDAIKTLLPCLKKNQDWRITNHCPYYKDVYSLRCKDGCCDIPVYAFVHPSRINQKRRKRRGTGSSYADLLRSKGFSPRSYMADAIQNALKMKI